MASETHPNIQAIAVDFWKIERVKIFGQFVTLNEIPSLKILIGLFLFHNY